MPAAWPPPAPGPLGSLSHLVPVPVSAHREARPGPAPRTCRAPAPIASRRPATKAAPVQLQPGPRPAPRPRRIPPRPPPRPRAPRRRAHSPPGRPPGRRGRREPGPAVTAPSRPSLRARARGPSGGSAGTRGGRGRVPREPRVLGGGGRSALMSAARRPGTRPRPPSSRGFRRPTRPSRPRAPLHSASCALRASDLRRRRQEQSGHAPLRSGRSPAVALFCFKECVVQSGPVGLQEGVCGLWSRSCCSLVDLCAEVVHIHGEGTSCLIPSLESPGRSLWKDPPPNVQRSCLLAALWTYNKSG